MRQDRTVQASIFDLFAKHEIGCELKSRVAEGSRTPPPSQNRT